jgi:hypothetical protein
MTMLTDGINGENKKEEVENLDLAEMLDRAMDYEASDDAEEAAE